MSSCRGVRRPNGTDPRELTEGEFAFWGGRWWVFPPGAAGPGSMDHGMVVEHKDGSISSSSAIRDPGRFHGKLIRGRWVW